MGGRVRLYHSRCFPILDLVSPEREKRVLVHLMNDVIIEKRSLKLKQNRYPEVVFG